MRPPPARRRRLRAERQRAVLPERVTRPRAFSQLEGAPDQLADASDSTRKPSWP
ncbi:hypothetical protein I552_8981 [Mycobacterium xenopi 3993]|nr:hypothetical protein I552_8981 [Mycobacterium xenopi 3993]